MASKMLVDVHTHVYLPRYASLLRSRTTVPLIRAITTPGGTSEDRLLILENEPSGGRPVGPQYWDREGEGVISMVLHQDSEIFSRETQVHG